MALKPSINTPYAARPAQELYGIDGWLRLIQFHMGLYVLFTLYRIFTDFQAVAAGWTALLLIMDIIIAFFQIGLLIVSFILMIN